VIKTYVKILFKNVQRNTLQNYFISKMNIHTILSTVASLVPQIYNNRNIKFHQQKTISATRQNSFRTAQRKRWIHNNNIQGNSHSFHTHIVNVNAKHVYKQTKLISISFLMENCQNIKGFQTSSQQYTCSNPKFDCKMLKIAFWYIWPKIHSLNICNLSY